MLLTVTDKHQYIKWVCWSGWRSGLDPFHQGGCRNIMEIQFDGRGLKQKLSDPEWVFWNSQLLDSFSLARFRNVARELRLERLAIYLMKLPPHDGMNRNLPHEAV